MLAARPGPATAESRVRRRATPAPDGDVSHAPPMSSFGTKRAPTGSGAGPSSVALSRRSEVSARSRQGKRILDTGSPAEKAERVVRLPSWPLAFHGDALSWAGLLQLQKRERQHPHGHGFAILHARFRTTAEPPHRRPRGTASRWIPRSRAQGHAQAGWRHGVPSCAGPHGRRGRDGYHSTPRSPLQP